MAGETWDALLAAMRARVKPARRLRSNNYFLSPFRLFFCFVFCFVGSRSKSMDENEAMSDDGREEPKRVVFDPD